jgi:hypothetical protein
LIAPAARRFREGFNHSPSLYSIVHDSLFERNYLMHKFTKKMQIPDGLPIRAKK